MRYREESTAFWRRGPGVLLTLLAALFLHGYSDEAGAAPCSKIRMISACKNAPSLSGLRQIRPGRPANARSVLQQLHETESRSDPPRAAWRVRTGTGGLDPARLSSPPDPATIAALRQLGIPAPAGIPPVVILFPSDSDDIEDGIR